MPTTTATATAPSRLSALAVPTFAPVAHAVLRIGAGLLFMQHGAQKLFGFLGGVDGNGATVELLSQFGLAGVLEFFGGALVVLGLFTRPVAAVLTALMVAAYSIAHAFQAVFPVQNGGELALLYALVFAFLAAAGPGAWSLDGRRRTR
ncbi:MAG: DoxX family protein [Rhodothermales bacterium]